MPLFKGLFGRKKETPPAPRCAAVVVAAGSGQRMGQDKIMMKLGEDPVILHTIRALERSPLISEIVVVTREDLIVPISQLCRDFAMTKVRKVVAGGETRAKSVRLGTLEVSREAELIAIHDGARPLVSQEVIRQTVETAAAKGAAAPAVPLSDTIKSARGGVVERTLDRTALFAVQTPQVFEAGLIKAALQKALEENVPITDDCSAVERLGMSVVLTQGERENIKLTTPADLIMARAILEERETS